MDYRELIIEAFTSLFANKVRTGLAMLGVVIGVGSVIALMSLGQSSQKAVQNQIKSLGSNLLIVMPGAQRTGGIRGAMGGLTTLTYEDAQAIQTASIRHQLINIKTVASEYSNRAQVVAGRNNTNTRITGVTPEYQQIRNIDLASGSFFNQQHLASLSKVAVLGAQTSEELFGEGANPVGRTIRIKGNSFKVIGVAKRKGGSGPMNQDDQIFVPLTTAQKILFGVDYLTAIYLEAVSEKVINQARDEVGYFLLNRHKIKDPYQADFYLISQEDVLETAKEITSTFTALLSGIAAISLVVGGIGIMNIMLVSVTERTREIGLRQALGAKKKWIAQQFLFEAVMITFIGGIIGILIGSGASFLISHSMGLPPTLSLSSILLAFVVSVGVGTIFGWYPAQKAAKLQPIEALRYE